jgi:prepilin-type N-terminal cleavage/methylation domain-containing protein
VSLFHTETIEESMNHTHKKHNRHGYTLAELLIVVAIIAVIALIFLLMNWRKSLYAGYDAQRKTDLVNIRRAFEEYYNDKGCYPDADILNNCKGNQLDPFIAKIPCDPSTGQPYLYSLQTESNVCLGSRVCAKLQDWSDPDITKLGCDPEQGCGWGAYWNYCVSSGASVTPFEGIGLDVTPSPSPTPTPSWFGDYACRPGIQVSGIVLMDGQCNNVGSPGAFGCQYSFEESNCQGRCSQISYWCAQ